MTAWAIEAAEMSEWRVADHRIMRSCHRKPVSTADRKLIDAFKASKQATGETVVVPRGVSGMDEKKEKETVGWLGSRTGISPVRRHKLSLRTQKYRAMYDLGYKPKKIAKLLHVTVNTVMTQFRQMRLGRAGFISDG